MMDLGSDWVHRAVTLVLLAMSVASWVLLLYKTWLLARASKDVPRSLCSTLQTLHTPQTLQSLPTWATPPLLTNNSPALCVMP